MVRVSLLPRVFKILTLALLRLVVDLGLNVTHLHRSPVRTERIDPSLWASTPRPPGAAAPPQPHCPVRLLRGPKLSWDQQGNSGSVWLAAPVGVSLL